MCREEASILAQFMFRVGYATEEPPFLSLDESNVARGISVELLSAFAASKNATPTFIEFEHYGLFFAIFG